MAIANVTESTSQTVVRFSAEQISSLELVWSSIESVTRFFSSHALGFGVPQSGHCLAFPISTPQSGQYDMIHPRSCFQS
ncbi:MAG TPA: hypothetical protein PKZ23_07345, partial [Rectinema sp.]|nr:hypothetical protein [Rectinema sp.]